MSENLQFFFGRRPLTVYANYDPSIQMDGYNSETKIFLNKGSTFSPATWSRLLAVVNLQPILKMGLMPLKQCFNSI